ncbi:MAG: hypothetical protein CL923_06810 [Deltaproteobacteria bacterium]|nr:hypothetical protein [Deltaproteobacteria bacterium]MDP7156973.1 hypothetical protein [SAR324 cluster bacterium]MDP7318524.1 hypothetical protein [SAR324 cluster bacterium]MDP7629970.1 hypothetical protein [SAR324 cluster bacterium]
MPASFHALCGLALLASVGYLALLFRKRHPFRKTSLFLRISLLLLLLILAQVTSTQQLRDARSLHVLVDSSASMAKWLDLPEGGHTGNSPDEWLPTKLVSTIKQDFPDHDLHFIDLFAGAAGPAGWPSQSPLIAALQRFHDDARLPAGSEVLLVSDGLDTEQPQAWEALAQQWQDSKLVIHTLVPPIRPQPGAGLRIDTALRVAFVNQPLTMQVTVHASLPERQHTDVVLMDGRSVLARKSVELPAGDSKTPLELAWMPMLRSETLLTLKLLPVAPDSNPHDNLAYLPITVRTPKLKVLHIAGRPSWDVLQLRQQLKSLPEMDLIAFFILRNPFEDSQNIPESELALIQFPVQELFLRELFKFDTVLFHNFDIQTYLRKLEFRQSFQRYLAEGGRIIVIGGEDAKHFEGYQELFLTEGTGLGSIRFQHQPQWRFREQDLLSPVQLQQQAGFQTLLVKFSTAPSPLLIRTPYRYGRVDWILEPASWQWRRPPDSGNRLSHNLHFSLLWQALLQQPRHERQAIFQGFRTRPYHVSEPIHGMIEPPTKATRVWLEVLDPQFDATVHEEALDLSGQNPYIQLPALSSGMYTLQVSCRCTDMRDATFPLTVVDEWLEQHEIAPNLPALHLLAERTGGQILTTVP